MLLPKMKSLPMSPVLAWITAVVFGMVPLDSLAQAKRTVKKPSKPAAPAEKSAAPPPDPAPASPTSEARSYAPNVSLAPEDLREFAAQPAAVRQLIESSLALARRNLTYTFGSADPAQGGMDCSGFIYYILRQHGFADLPRDSRGLYTWVRKARAFRAVISRAPDAFELDELLPGDLLFWTGTYAVEQDPPISHVMLYLGTEKTGGGRVMIGSSDGRSYHGQKRNGVSVFDFVMPRASQNGETRATFVGYARIPGLRD